MGDPGSKGGILTKLFTGVKLIVISGKTGKIYDIRLCHSAGGGSVLLSDL